MSQEIKWSTEQQAAIEALNGNYLVSAGAGSGKTAVLTERVYYLIKQGYSLSRLLIMTFTEPASMEMKSRIYDRLCKDKETVNLANDVLNSHIETFDAFSSFIVKKYAFYLGIAANFIVLDQGIASIKTRKIIQEKFDLLYEKGDPLFLKMINDCCVKDDASLKEIVFKVIELSHRALDKDAFYKTFVDNFYNEDYFLSRLNQEKKLVKDFIKSILDASSQLEDASDAENIEAALAPISKTDSYDETNSLILSTSFPTKPSTPTSDKAYRDSIKTDYDNFKKKWKYGSEEVSRQLYFANKEYVSLLVDIAYEVDKQMDIYKKSINAYCFADIAMMALKLLEDKKICQELKDSFDFIMVDEYQDTNDIQETIISKISNNNVYMVGDIKQSIYRFRNANCDIFNEKYNNYSLNNGGTKIDMNTSFRSRVEVVDFVNDVFSKLMNANCNPIDYEASHIFKSGFDAYKSLIDSNEDYKVEFYNYTLEEKESREDKEISIIIDDIIYKIEHHYQVYDKDIKGLRDCSYKDFAIILDRGTSFNEYRRQFAKCGIPLFVINNEKIKTNDIVFVIRNLIKLYYYSAIQKYDDEYVHTFVSISRSFLMETKDQDIYTIVKSKLYLSSSLHERIMGVINRCKNASLFEITNELFKEFDLYYKIMSIRHFEDNAHKAESLLMMAKQMDDLGFGILDLVTYFNDIDNLDEDIDFKGSKNSSDSVTLINIHKSKGLEYPFVYFPGLSKRFNRDNDTSFIVNKGFGVLLPYKNIDGVNYTSLMNHLYRIEEAQKDFEEKLRLLYVAITRVKERAIIIFEDKEYKKPLSLVGCNNFAQLLAYFDFQYKYGVPYVFKGSKKSVKTSNKGVKDIKFDSINVVSTPIYKTKASKEYDGQIDESLLELGTKLHYLLEIADYENKDTSFIKQPRLRKYVDNVLRSPLFNGVKNKDIIHEYQYYDEENNVHGIIDALVMRNDYIDIIDFKLKNIDDDKYVLQLKTYRDYISKISNKPIKMHLLSSITGEEKEIV